MLSASAASALQAKLEEANGHGSVLVREKAIQVQCWHSTNASYCSHFYAFPE
jgi:hypothetical protein